MAFYDKIHSSKQFRLGTVKTDYTGNEYVYLKGVASLAQYEWVVYDELGVSIRMITTSIGPAAISQSANTSTTNYSWFLIKGSGSGRAEASYADDATVNATATAGSVDDNAVAAAAELNVFGAWGRSVVNATTTLATFQLQYPYKSLALLD